MTTSVPEIFGRVREDGNISVLYREDGVAVTTLDVDGVYPVDSEFGTRYEHPGGIVLTPADAARIGLVVGEEEGEGCEQRTCDSCGKLAPPKEYAEAHGWFLDTVLTVTDDGRTVVETETRCPVCW